MIVEAKHFPVVPRSTNTVTITTRLIDEVPTALSATLFFRVDSATPPDFSTAPLHDDGLNGDAASNDGIYSVTIGPFGNNSVIEYYIAASDQNGNSRTWPAPAIPAPDQIGPSMQVVNALFQVDDTIYA